MSIIKILSIEPTPSPNVMKLNMNETLPAGVSRNFTKKKTENAPDYISRLLAVEGVQGVFQVQDFIAIERHPKAQWKEILAHAGQILGDDSILTTTNPSAASTFGEVQVSVQIFKGIPMQVKLAAESEEVRFGLPERFAKAISRAQTASQNLILERKWEDQGVRYGTFKEIGEEVVQEISAAYDEARLEALVAQANDQHGASENKAAAVPAEQTVDMLDHPDWEKRFAALDRINPTVKDLPILARALEDSETSIRRLATVYLGMIGTEALPHLFKALKDKSAAVRRTAGDAISDIGDPLAIGPMSESLQDANKLVRWRAARFLYEVGDSSAVPALREAQDDTEFEVSLQASMALERIERGEAASGTVWQQMTRSITKPDHD
jgi:hypothetical protein